MDHVHQSRERTKFPDSRRESQQLQNPFYIQLCKTFLANPFPRVNQRIFRISCGQMYAHSSTLLARRNIRYILLRSTVINCQMYAQRNSRYFSLACKYSSRLVSFTIILRRSRETVRVHGRKKFSALRTTDEDAPQQNPR